MSEIHLKKDVLTCVNNWYKDSLSLILIQSDKIELNQLFVTEVLSFFCFFTISQLLSWLLVELVFWMQGS
jgi:hypothetical protein